MHKNCVGSNRIYDSEYSYIFNQELYDFNSQKYFAYNLYFLYKFYKNLLIYKSKTCIIYMII